MAVETQEAQIVRIRELSPSVREMTLAPRERSLSFRPGQWVSLHLPVGERPPLVRAYSMAEPETVSGRIVLAFDRVPQGLGSGYLFERQEGETVRLAGPYGKFTLPEDLSRELLLVARFTGIVPIRCILRHLFTRENPSRVTLIYSAPRAEDLIYHEEILEMASLYPAFKYLPPLSPGEAADPHRPCRQEIEVIGSIFAGRKDYFPMVCGVKAFVQPLRSYFKELGFGRGEARYETYD